MMRNFLFVVGLLATGVAPTLGVTPVQKVIDMLNNMAAKSKAEKEDDIATFKEFEKFCQGSARAKVRSIAENTAVVGKLEGEIGALNLEVNQLSADIAKSDADIGLLADKIKNLDAKSDGIQSEEQEITVERKEEHGLFEGKDTDYSNSVDALDRAVSEMGKVTLLQKSSEEKHLALLQIAARTLPRVAAAHPPGWARREIDNFLNRDSEISLLQAPTGEAAAYESQSGGIKELFQGLEEKLADERTDGQKGEAEEKHIYDVMMLQLNSQLKETKYERDQKAAAKAKASQNLATAEGEKAATEKAVAEDQKYLAELKAECEAKAAAFADRQATRAGEIEAIGKAVEILSGGAVSGAAAKHLPGLLQTKKRGIKKSLAQLRTNVASPLQKRVAAFLQEKAASSNSRTLSNLAAKVAQDPFGKVLKMIKDMIAKLTAEANEEAEQKGFCDAELGANQATRDEKTSSIDSLNAEIEELTATETKLAQDIAQLSATVQDLSTALADATKLRFEEKEKNLAAIADAKAATVAVNQATTVLREFYAKAAQATGGYGGSQDSATGVMSFLEVVGSDFSRLEEETTAGESQAADDFSAFSADTNEAVDTNNADIKAKTTTKTETAKNLETAKVDLRNTQGELKAAMDYYEKLKPSCVDSGISYEERVARRKEEIESLREAVGILDGTSVAVF